MENIGIHKKVIFIIEFVIEVWFKLTGGKLYLTFPTILSECRSSRRYMYNEILYFRKKKVRKIIDKQK